MIIRAKNPYRYRGYRYDTETGLYYLQSRYYNPEMGRFINADGLVDSGGLFGHNMYAYCANNPVNNFDPSGYHGASMNAMHAAMNTNFYAGSSAHYYVAMNPDSALAKQWEDAKKPKPPLIPTVKPNKTLEEKKQFAVDMYARARKDALHTKIPPEIMTAQACLESGYGSSPAAVNKNNLFGIMSKGKIASFSSIDECILKYERVLSLSYYKDLYNSSSIEEWAFGIGPLGYCPEPDYGEKLWDQIGTLKKWGVFQ